MRKLRVEVWSDVVCPWCYIGKRRLDAAIARMPSPQDVEVVWRSFELDPGAPRAPRARTTYAERLARKYRASLEQANATIDRITRAAAADGLDLRFDRVRPARSFDAHRVLHLARARGMQAAVAERLMRAYFTEGEAIGDRRTLVRLAAEAGLHAEEVARVLAGNACADGVRADEAEAAKLGIHAVPFFGIAGVYGVPGAQPVEVLHGALAQAWSEAPDEAPPSGSAEAAGARGVTPAARGRRARATPARGGGRAPRRSGTGR